MSLKIIYGCILVPFLLTCVYTHPKYAQAPAVPIEQMTVPELGRHFAVEYGVEPSRILSTIECESSYNPMAIGDGGHSYGLAQIHLPSHPKITKEQALDKVFAVRFMAREFSKGNARIWTCARKLGLT